MQNVLSQLITVPGVVGGMIYDRDGTLLSKTFPPLFDDAMLANAARVLVDGAAGLETVTGDVGMIDMRFADARIVVRPMAGAHLVLLCAAQTNLQLLNISTSVAVPKIEKLVAARPTPEPERIEIVALPPAEAAPAAPVLSRKEAKAAKRNAEQEKQDAPPPDEDPGFFHW